MIKIDGVSYRATWEYNSLEQDAQITNGENSGRIQGTWEMYLEYQGTFLNHTGNLLKDNGCSEKEWSDIFLVLMNPINEHTIEFPFGVDQILKQKIYVSSIKRKLKKIEKNKHYWEGVYSVSFVAKKPAWNANGTLEGVNG